MVLSDAYVKIGAVVLDKEGTSVAINWSAEVPSIRVFGQKNAVRYDDNPTDWTMEFEFVYSPEHAEVFAALVGKMVDVEVRPSSGPVSATNPAYRATIADGSGMIVESYTPFSGNAGDVVVSSISGVAAGDLSVVVSDE